MHLLMVITFRVFFYVKFKNNDNLCKYFAQITDVSYQKFSLYWNPCEFVMDFECAMIFALRLEFSS